MVDEPGRSFRPETLAVRGGLSRTGFDETSEALFLTSGFVYESAEQAEAAFKDEVEQSMASHVDEVEALWDGRESGSSSFASSSSGPSFVSTDSG